MKKINIKTAIIVIAIGSLASCKKKDNGPDAAALDRLLIVTNINNGAVPVGYIGTHKNLTVPNYTNAKSRQVTNYPIAYTQGNNVWYVPYRLLSAPSQGDNLKKYTRAADGTLAESGTLVLPANSAPVGLAFESDTKAYCTLANMGKIAIFNPTTLTVSGYIDLTTYALGDGSPDPTNILYRNNKLYVCLAQTPNGYSTVYPAQVLIIDLANGNSVTSATDSRAYWAGSLDSKHTIFFSENGDLYISCIASYGFIPGQKGGILRIKSGQTAFDPTYFLNLTDYVIAGIPGGKVDYFQHLYYTGNGIVYASGNIPALVSNPPDYVNDYSFGYFKVDLNAKTITKMNTPYANGYAHYVLPFEDKILLAMATKTGVGIYTYDPVANSTSPAPVVTTQGDPSVIEVFN